MAVSRQAGARPKGWGSQQGVALVIQRGAGAQHSLRGGVFKGQGSRQGVDPAQSNRWGSQWGVDPARSCDGNPGGGGAWIQRGAVARRSPRGGEPGRVEELLCRATRWGLGRLNVLLLDHEVEKLSTI
jgi:hypothetical protein